MSISRNSLSRATFILIILLIVAFSSLSLAQNDPGHDTLYIEQEGDSELTGNLNVTGNVSIEGIIYSGSDLDVRGDSVQASSSNNQIIGTNSILSIQSIGDLYINTFQGTTSTVYLGDGGGDSVNINITGALYFGSSGRLAVSSGSQAGSDLYWGNKLICDASESNCGWVNSTTGGGDITAVNTNDDWLLGGAETGDVSLTFNESKLNGTIDARATALGDGNNYTTAAGFVTSGSTKTLQIEIRGRSNVTASFTDTDTTYTNSTGIALSGTTFSLATGVMTAGSYGNSTAVPICTYDTYGRATSCTNTSISFPAVSSGGNLSAQGATAGYIPQFQNGSIVNNSVIFQNGTNIGIGTTSPGAYKLRVFGGNVAIEGSAGSPDPSLTLSTGSNTGGNVYISQFGGANTTSGIVGGIGFSNFDGAWSLAQVAKIEVFRGSGGAAEGYMSFFTKTQAGSIEERMRINPDGNVGIGDTTPEAILDVQSTSGINQLRVSFDDSNFGNISVNSGGNMTIKATGHVIIDLS